MPATADWISSRTAMFVVPPPWCCDALTIRPPRLGLGDLRLASYYHAANDARPSLRTPPEHGLRSGRDRRLREDVRDEPLRARRGACAHRRSLDAARRRGAAGGAAPIQRTASRRPR